MSKKDRESYNAYMRTYMLARYQRRRAQALEILGNKCTACGSVDELEIDHINRSDKVYDLGKLFTGAPWPRITKELEVCQALCRSCHIEKSRAESSVPHGGGASGRRNCKCAPCRDRKAQYMRAREINRAIREAIEEHAADVNG